MAQFLKNQSGQKWYVTAYDTSADAFKTGDAANITAKIKGDHGTATAITDTNPTEVEDGVYAFDLTQGETNYDHMVILPESSTSDILVIGEPRVMTPAGLVLDENTTEHTTDGTVGQALKPTRTGTAQGGSTNTIQLDASANANDDWYAYAVVEIGGGTGAGQCRIIESYTGSTKTATISPNWVTAPDATSIFKLYPLGSIPGATAPTASANAAAVWDALKASYLVAGSFGEALQEIVPSAATSAAAVWDALTASHLTSGSFGQMFQPLRTATAQAGGAAEITLDASASASDDFYNNTLIQIVGGTGAGQARFVDDYTGSTKVADVAAWVTNPDVTSVFVISAFGAVPGASAPTAVANAAAVWDRVLNNTNHNIAASAGKRMRQVQNLASKGDSIESGTAQAGAATTITLRTGASATDDIYNSQILAIVGGTGEDQVRMIGDYVGSTKVATVETWTTTPDATSKYEIFPATSQNMWEALTDDNDDDTGTFGTLVAAKLALITSATTLTTGSLYATGSEIMIVQGESRDADTGNAIEILIPVGTGNNDGIDLSAGGPWTPKLGFTRLVTTGGTGEDASAQFDGTVISAGVDGSQRLRFELTTTETSTLSLNDEPVKGFKDYDGGTSGHAYRWEASVSDATLCPSFARGPLSVKPKDSAC